MRQYNLGRSRVAFGYQSGLHKVPEKYLEGEKDLFLLQTRTEGVLTVHVLDDEN